jgi:hypothetical protein
MGVLIDDKPVKITVEFPTSVHRDLISYAEALARLSGRSIRDSANLIAPMVARFYGNGPRFPEIAKIGLARNACPLVDFRSTPPYGLDGWRLAGSRKISFGGFLFRAPKIFGANLELDFSLS